MARKTIAASAEDVLALTPTGAIMLPPPQAVPACRSIWATASSSAWAVSPSTPARLPTVDNIYNRALTEQKLEAHQIVADLTGGFKPMTAGMVMACLSYGRLLEYTESKRDATDQLIDGTQRVIEVGVDFN